MASDYEPPHAVTVYPFHGSYPGLPDLYHVRCAQHPDFTGCVTASELGECVGDHLIAVAPRASALRTAKTSPRGTVRHALHDDIPSRTHCGFVARWDISSDPSVEPTCKLCRERLGMEAL